MRLLCSLAFILFASVSHAAEWRNDLFGVTANLPESPGWAPIAAENSTALTVLVAMQHPQRQTVFGVNVLHDLPSSNLRDPATIQKIETTLRSLGYQWIGRSTVPVGGREWVQFPVKALNNGQVMTGLIRYTSANNQVYAVSLLKGGGQEAAQDAEMQAAASSVRIADLKPAAPVAPAPAVVADAGKPEAPKAAETTPAAPAKDAAKPGAVEEGGVAIGPVKLTKKQFNLVMYCLGGLLVLLILLKVIGGGGSTPKKPTAVPRR